MPGDRIKRAYKVNNIVIQSNLQPPQSLIAKPYWH